MIQLWQAPGYRDNPAGYLAHIRDAATVPEEAGDDNIVRTYRRLGPDARAFLDFFTTEWAAGTRRRNAGGPVTLEVVAPWRCPRCGNDEETSGGVDTRICRHVAEDGGMRPFTDRVDFQDGQIEHKHCGERSCPLKDVCVDCWQNLYDGITVQAWWPAG